MLTIRQQEVYDFVKEYKSINQGITPRLVDIADNFGWASPNSAKCHLDLIVKKGYLKRDRRALMIVDNSICATCGGRI